MGGSDDEVAGFALGALLHDGERGETWANVISGEFAERVRACLRDVRSAPDKRAALAELIARVRPAQPDMSALPALARAQLVPGARKEPRPTRRNGYVADPDLLAMLQRLAPRLGKAAS